MQENDAMALHDILVVLDGTSRDEATLGVAAWLARRHDAHLTGFCPLELLYPASLGLAISGYGELPLLEETIGQLTAEAEKSAALIETTFRERLRRDDLRGDWQVAHGYATQAVSRRSRTADLLVISQTDARHPLPVNANGLIEDVLIGSGRPMLLVPYAGRFETVGANVLIGWSGTREAARAVHDALPLMTRESVVTILTVEQSNERLGPHGYSWGGACRAPGPARRERQQRANGCRWHQRRRRDPELCRRRGRRSAGDGRLRPFPRTADDSGRGQPGTVEAYDIAGADVALRRRVGVSG
jgi:hypothetical protein